jgi:hypothetical protein
VRPLGLRLVELADVLRKCRPGDGRDQHETKSKHREYLECHRPRPFCSLLMTGILLTLDQPACCRPSHHFREGFDLLP